MSPFSRFLVVCLVSVATDAWAEPHPDCPGLCPDGETACGRESDCDAPCAFVDACLPGFAPLIEEVVADGPGGLGDPSTWICGFLRCRPDPIDPATLLFGSDYGITAIAVKDLVLEPGRRYLVRAEMRADADTWGYFDVTGDFVGADSAEVAGPSDWTPVSAMFEVPPGGGALQLRLHADGPGELGIRKIVVLVLGEYGVYLRFALLEPEVAASAREGFILRHSGEPPGFYPTACASPDEVTEDCIDPKLTEVAIPAQGPSPWVDVSAMFAGGYRATHGWQLLDAEGKPFLFTIRVRVDVAYRPDESAIFFSDDQFPGFSGVGLVLPDGVPSPTELREQTGFIRDIAVSDLGAFTPAAARPQAIAVGTIVNTIDVFDRFAPIAEASLELQRDLGLNAVGWMGDMPNSSDRQTAKDLGLTKRFFHAETLLAPYDYGTSHDYDLEAIRAQVRLNLTEAYWQNERASLQAAPDEVLAILGDEIGGLMFAGPGYREAFTDWLAEEDLTPEELGVTDLAEVDPLEDMGWWRVPDVRPNPSDAHAAARYVAALRFWNVATARAYAAALDELDTWIGAPVRAAFNAGTPLAGNYFQWALGTEFQTMASAGATTSFFGEGFLSYLDDCLAWDLGYYGDWARAEAGPWREADRRFALASYLHAYRGDSGRKMLELAARGFTWFNHYAYGPYDLSTGDGPGGLGAASGPWLDRVARGSELVAAFEDALVGVEREPSPIAMLGSQSDSVWTDLGAATPEEIGWHVALSQAHYPVDIMMEADIAAGRLEGPGAPKRVLIVLRKHVSRAAWAAIERWVEDGGTLVLGPDLAGWDERGQFDFTRADWLGLAAGDEHAASASETMSWETEDGVATFFFDSPWRDVNGVGATALATSSGDLPVAVRAARGQGRVVAIGLALGEAFRATSLACTTRPASLPPRYPDAFSDSMRAAIASVPNQAGLGDLRPIRTDDSHVSIQRVRTARGPAVVAVAYSNEPVNAALSADAWQGCARVHEVLSDIELPVVFGTVIAPLERAAVITWDPNECHRPVVVEPADDGAEEPPKRRDDDGCAGGSPAHLAWVFSILALRAKRLRVVVPTLVTR